jgi:spermidine/putrescine transport system substrate-binding protein
MKLKRRELLAASAGAAAAVSFAPRAFAQREKELNILCWEGYNSADVLDPFRTEFGAEVRAESLTNDPTMISRLRGGETSVWDLINVNNPWARKVMHPEGLIVPLDRARFEHYFERMMPAFHPPYRWAMSDDGTELLGMAQRFGPYSYVANTDKISRATAEEQGWNLFNDPSLFGRYGVLESDDWNVYNICLIAGFHPFREHTEEEFSKFDATARQVFGNAKVVTGDIFAINQALVNGEIDLQMTGGTYTSSIARADGHANIRGITPKSGPMDGKGGLVWIEITSPVNNPQLSPLAFDFLEYVQRPEMGRVVAFAEGTFNPVTQMGNPEVFSQFSAEDLDIIQWDSLEEELAGSVEYDINPDYDRMYDLMSAAKRESGRG